MAWQNKTESYLNSLPLARSSADAVRVAASETRVYAVYKGTDNRLTLGELRADGTFDRQLGKLFTQTNAEIKGLTWDVGLGALRALVQVGSNQFLYRVDITDGSASGAIQLPSGSLYTGLARRGTQLLTQGAGNTTLHNITITGASASVRAITGTSPVTGASQRGLAMHGANNLLVLSSTGTIANLNLSFGTGSNITWPAPGDNYCGITVFGGNILLARATDTSLGLGNTYLLRNTSTVRQGTSDVSVPATFSGTVPIAKRDDHHIYAVLNNRLVLINLSGTQHDIGSVPNSITCLIWAPIANQLYAIAGNQIYTLDTSDGSTTSTNTLRSAIAAVAGFENGQGRLTVWDAAGAISNVFTANGLVNAGGVGNLGANRGGFYAEGHYWTVDSTGNIRRRGPNTGDASTVVLDPEPIVSGNRTASGLFEVNGVAYTFAWRSASNNIRPLKYEGLFPRLYRQGSIIDLLTVPDVRDREYDAGYTSETVILPAATGGASPFTYELRYNGSTTLPSGFSFNANTRALVVAASIASGRYRFTYHITDSETPAQSVEHAFEIAIDPPVAQPPVGNLALTSQTLSRVGGTATSIQLASATGGTLPYTYACGEAVGVAGAPTTRWGSGTTLGQDP